MSKCKEIWNKLATTHEGTNQVKESKISLLTLDFELFKIKSRESIKEMFNIFTDIINGLKSLGKAYSNKQMMKKLLNSLSKEWEAKVTTIEESKDLDKLSLDELISSLITYEMKLEHGKFAL
ncbi:UBN2 domain-containing protein [Gossypium australe]|uniref:UBN2 domain-containing protein n=1 Tax=Gossypium australe TaxID=47621 RepID=A0A5B6W6K4_9ROSI|nr:UBN2 domain-containing protein [Gossypium australe]